jgi:glutaredoxin/glutathione-dependent peroxiredoxin
MPNRLLHSILPSPMPPLRLGSIAPDFSADTTKGHIDSFHNWIDNSWAVLFSHPADFTPVCTTELGEVARRSPDFAARGVKLIGLSANGLESHEKWIVDINEVGNPIGPTDVQFPIVILPCYPSLLSILMTLVTIQIADADRKISTLYDMLDAVDPTNVDAKGIPFTVRTVFVIDPKKVIRLTISYPAQTGRNFDEILRVIDSLQLGDNHKVTTPVNWKKGEDVIIHPGVNDEQAKTLFPGYRTVKVSHTFSLGCPNNSNSALLALGRVSQSCRCITTFIYIASRVHTSLCSLSEDLCCYVTRNKSKQCQPSSQVLQQLPIPPPPLYFPPCQSRWEISCQM